jgi:hypothetical protein
MKLKDYIVKLQKVADKHPNSTVVFAVDEEGNSFAEDGNSFAEVNFTPTLGNFGDGTFIADDGTFEFYEYGGINAVCLN